MTSVTDAKPLPANTREAAVELLRLVRNHLSAFEMNDWYRTNQHGAKAEDGYVLKLENITEGVQKCGTTLCLAGFAGIAMGEAIEFKYSEYDEVSHGYRVTAPSNKYSETWEDEGEQVTREYAKSWSTLGAEFLHLKHNLQSELFYTSNEKALAMLVDLARGVPEKVVLDSLYNGYYSRFSGMHIDEIADYYVY